MTSESAANIGFVHLAALGAKLAVGRRKAMNLSQSIGEPTLELTYNCRYEALKPAGRIIDMLMKQNTKSLVRQVR